MIYEFLADGFEETEAVTPLDMLKRAGADIKTVSIGKSEYVKGANGIIIKADTLISKISDIPQLVILPGGMPGAKNLRNSDKVYSIVMETYRTGGYVSAICASPFILEELGLLNGRKATCYPGFEKFLKGAEILPEKVVRDGNVITAAGMGAALLFGAELISVLYGKEKADGVLRSVIAL